jgi:hypothetical protein
MGLLLLNRWLEDVDADADVDADVDVLMGEIVAEDGETTS